jgi:hypothetical protein
MSSTVMPSASWNGQERRQSSQAARQAFKRALAEEASRMASGGGGSNGKNGDGFLRTWALRVLLGAVIGAGGLYTAGDKVLPGAGPDISGLTREVALQRQAMESLGGQVAVLIGNNNQLLERVHDLDKRLAVLEMRVRR